MSDTPLVPTPAKDTPWIQRSAVKRAIAAGVAAAVAGCSTMAGLLADGKLTPAEQFTALGVALGILYAVIQGSAVTAARTATANKFETHEEELATLKAELARLKAGAGKQADPEVTLPRLKDIDG